jgi:predicted tellurium resistance membrane protein TerC
MLTNFKYLKPALAMILLLVGVKMLSAKWLKEVLGDYFNFYILGAVLLILAVGIVASLWVRSSEEKGA